MKPRAFVLPAIALLASGIFLTSQRRAISSIEEKTRLLLRQGAAIPDDSTSPGRTPRPQSTNSGTSSINWRRLAEIGGERYPGIFEKQEVLLLNNRIRNMTPDELLAALAEVRSLNLDIRSRGELETKLLRSLVEKAPGAALDHLTEGDNEHLGLSIDSADILSSWVAKDSAAAIAWLDGKTASGAFETKTLDGKNHRRLRLEAILLSHLIGSDTGTISLLLSAIPETHRSQVFSEFISPRREGRRPLSDSELTAYASLVRDHLPAGEQEEVIFQPAASILRQGDYDQIDGYFEIVDATPSERRTAIGQAASAKFFQLKHEDKLTTDEIDLFRQWTASHIPEAVDRITAEALRSIAYSGDTAFRHAADLAFHYHQATGNDEILVRFLQHSHGNSERASALAENIADPALRAQVLEKIK